MKNNSSVRAKKHLGQHFLTDESIANKIADSLLNEHGYEEVLEIGPGTAALTKFLLQKEFTTYVTEIDNESVEYLKAHFPELQSRILTENFLQFNPQDHFSRPIGLCGNFPYNISSQIMFAVYEHRDWYPEVCGMFQKEVAERIAAQPGSKTYCILSVLMQAFFSVEYLFTVDEHVFDPPPKVKSGVIRLLRNTVKTLPCDEKKFKTIVKVSFGQRRKTIRNSLKPFWKEKQLVTDGEIWTKRPEQLSVSQFIHLTQLLS